MFEKIKNDPYIHECYANGDNPNSKDGFWVYHGLRHVDNVVEMVEKILIQLDYDKEYIENAKIAALLHDMGYNGVKKDHDIRSCEMARKYFEKHNIKLKYQAEILDAIKSHRESFDSKNIMAIVLILADKIDIRKNRLAPQGYDIVGLRQFRYIKDIIILKNNNNLLVQFKIEEECDKEELESWYFIEKVFNAIESFAAYFNFNLKIMWNDDRWSLIKKSSIN